MSRHVVVTGAASGIGAEVCRVFAAQGDKVTGVDLRARPLRDALAGLPGATARPADLAEASNAERVIADAWLAVGPVDVLVNAAGIYPATPLLEMTARTWDRVQHVNVRAALLTTTELARRAIDAGRPACVVNVSSGAALRARPGATHYCASKAALEMLTRSCAVELGAHGIRVNAVSPGFVDVHSDVNPVTEEYAERVSANPLGRRGEAVDIALAVRWLSGEEAAWITGEVLRVDGGSSAGTTALPLHWPMHTTVQCGHEERTS